MIHQEKSRFPGSGTAGNAPNSSAKALALDEAKPSRAVPGSHPYRGTGTALGSVGGPPEDHPLSPEYSCETLARGVLTGSHSQLSTRNHTSRHRIGASGSLRLLARCQKASKRAGDTPVSACAQGVSS